MHDHDHAQPAGRRINPARIVRQVVILGCAFALLWMGNVINHPSAMQAQVNSDNRAATGASLRREFVDTLARLIGQSVEVLAVHDRINTPYAEIVLWQHDAANPGVIDIDELAVISHSRLFKTMTVYTAQPEAPDSVIDETRKPQTSHPKSQVAPRPGAAAGRNALSGAGLRLPLASVGANMMLDRAAVSDSGFCDRWRASPQVLPRVLGTELSDLMVEPAGPAGDELSTLRLTLTWASESSDGATDMSVLVKLMSPPRVRTAAGGSPQQQASAFISESE